MISQDVFIFNFLVLHFLSHSDFEMDIFKVNDVKERELWRPSKNRVLS